jgi:hypothetical protein
LAWRARLIRKYYLRPAYIWRQLKKCFKRPVMLRNYAKYGLKMLFGAGQG